MKGTTETWYGLAPDGSEVMIQHSDFMNWAYENEKIYSVGWSHAYVQNGKRLVRGPKMIATARDRGWNDLADKLSSYGFEDEQETTTDQTKT